MSITARPRRTVRGNMAEDFSLLPLPEAVTMLRLDQHFYNRTTLNPFKTAADEIARIEAAPAQLKRLDTINPNWRDNIRRTYPQQYFVRHYPRNATIDGDLPMDDLPGSDQVAGIVVDGNLTLNGSIINWEIDTVAAFLWVRGNLRCQNMIIGCMDLVVTRNVTASGLIVMTYNHGYLAITGDVRADRVIVDDDGAWIIDGKVNAKGWCASRNAEVALRASDWLEEIRPEFRSEFFDEDGGKKCGSGNVDLVKALLAGRDILKPEPKQPTKQSQRTK
jgi:hypothetical protein